jgi:hypothetical protein
VHIT